MRTLFTADTPRQNMVMAFIVLSSLFSVLLACTLPIAEQNHPPLHPQSAPGLKYREIQVGTPSTRYQGDAEVGIDAQGRFVVSWLQRSSAQHFNIFTQRFDERGQAQSEAQQVNTRPQALSEIAQRFADSLKSYRNVPQLAVAPDGDYAVLWGHAGHLWLRTYTPQGQAHSEARQIASLSEDGHADLLALPSGEWIAAWRAEWGEVQLQRFSTQGEALGDAHSPFGTLRHIRLTLTPQPSEALSTKQAEKASQAALMLLSEHHMQAYTAQLEPLGGAQPRTSIGEPAFTTEGLFWSRSHAQGAQAFLQLYKQAWDNGRPEPPQAEHIKVHEHKLQVQEPIHHRLASNRQRHLALLWGASEAAYTQGQIWLQRLDAQGKALESAVQLNPTQSGYVARPALNVNNSAQAVAVWQHWDDNRERHRIVARRLNLQQPIPRLLQDSPAPEAVDCSRESLATSQNIDPAFESFARQLQGPPRYTGPLEIYYLEGGHSRRLEAEPTDLSSASDTARFGSFTVNGAPFLRYQVGALIAHPRRTGCFADYLQHYDAQVQSQLGGFALIRVSPERAPLHEAERLLRVFLNATVERPARVEFSSLGALQTFLIYVESLREHGRFLKSLELNGASQSIGLPSQGCQGMVTCRAYNMPLKTQRFSPFNTVFHR